MSSRALRRLQGDSGLSELAGDGSDENANEEPVLHHGSEDEPSVKPKSKKKRNKKQRNATANPFELLNADIDAEAEVESEDEKDEVREGDQNGIESAEVKTAMKTKKKKKKRKGKDTEIISSENDSSQIPEDEVEASVQEVNRILGDPGGASAQGDCTTNTAVIMKPLLHIDYRNLNPETELRRMFGSEVVRGEQPNRNRRQRNQRVHRSSRLVQVRDTWHNTGGRGLTMKYLGENEGFVYEHSPAYQKLQFQFYDAVESGHPELIMEVLKENPYHIDALIQMADFHRMNEDYQTAAELIEKAIFGLESAFHPMFNLAGHNCFLDYRRPENRALQICLFKHILNLGRRGCNRTAFEFCKLLLSLDPGEDPLDCLSMIDYYALRSEQYDYIIQLEQDIIKLDCGLQVPNFAMSVPLTLYKIACRDGLSTEKADKMLQDKIMFFPMLLIPLLDECGVQPDKRVSSHSFFSTAELNDVTSELNRLVTMYVKRCAPCWKEPDVMAWLERNVTAVLDIVDEGKDPRIKKYPKRRYQRFRVPPVTLLRHYFLAEIPGLGLPLQNRHQSIFTYNPFPPTDSIITYTRPQRVTVASQQSGILGSFLRSVMPTYNPNEPADVAAARARANGATGGDEDGARSLPSQIHMSMRAVMQAMQELLNEGLMAPRRGQPGAPDSDDDEQDEVNENNREWEEDEENAQNDRR